MMHYQLGFAMGAEGVPCARPDDARAVAYEPSMGDIIHESECFAHVGDFEDEVMYG